jgi:hypothetical protein
MFKGSGAEEQAREAAHRLFSAELISSFIDCRSWKCVSERETHVWRRRRKMIYRKRLPLCKTVSSLLSLVKSVFQRTHSAFNTRFTLLHVAKSKPLVCFLHVVRLFCEIF